MHAIYEMCDSWNMRIHTIPAHEWGDINNVAAENIGHLSNKPFYIKGLACPHLWVLRYTRT